MTRSPIASPTHQVHQSEAKAFHGCTPPRQRLVTPIVAATTVLPRAARTMSARTSLRRSSAGSKPTRRSSQAPTTASRVFPSAMPQAVPTGSWCVILATNAPSAIPGVRRLPSTSSAASAMPVGGHTSVTWSATSASRSPRFAATT